MGDLLDAALAALALRINRLNEAIGRAVAWVVLALVAVQFTAVVLRYVFGAGWIWVEESIVYLHATLFMARCRLYPDARRPCPGRYLLPGRAPRDKAWVDLLGARVLPVPVSLLILVKTGPT